MSQHFIDGRWVSSASGETREIRCPADGSHVITVAEGGPQDADRAIAVARHAFDAGPWPSTPTPERAAILRAVADGLEAEADDVARLESLDTGKRHQESLLDMADVVAVFRHFAGIAQTEGGRVVDPGMPDVSSRVVTEPVGVCSLITPWNYPLLQTSWKVAPALAA